MNKKIVVIYKQPGQSPGYMRIENSDEEFMKVLGGEIEKLDLVEAYIVYLKNNEQLRANVHIRAGTNSMGITIKGHLLLVAKDKESGQIKSLTKKSAIDYGTYLIQRAYDYSNQAPDGHFYSKRQMKAMEFMRRQKEEMEKMKKKTESEEREQENKTIPKEEISEEESNDFQVSFKLKKDDTPDKDKKEVCVDPEITNVLKAILFALVEIRKDINSK